MKTAYCIALLCSVLTRPVTAESAECPVTFRARVTEIEPEQAARIHWRWGGEGLGGRPVRGELTRFLPTVPDAANSAADEFQLGAQAADRIVVKDKTYNYEYLKAGTWSRRFPLAELKRTKGRLFVTFTLEGHSTGTAIESAELEVEFSSRGKTFKAFRVQGSDGPTFGIAIPFHHLGNDGAPTAEFIRELGSLRDYAMWKRDALMEMPGIDKPPPRLYGIVTDCAGYKPGAGYGCRTADRATMLAEYDVLRLMGINGIRGCPAFILEMIREGEGLGKEFSRIHLTRTCGYPINMVHYADGRAPTREPGDGCPYHPDNSGNIPGRVKSAVDRILEQFDGSRVQEVWGLTVDEIGSVFDGAPERKAHQGCCPYCRPAFREMIRQDGRVPADFGATDWEDIRSTYGYWAVNFWETKRQLEESVARAKEALDAELKAELDATATLEDPDLDIGIGKKENKRDRPKELSDAEGRLETLLWRSKVAYVEPEEQKLRLSKDGWNLLHYYSRRFNCESSAKLFQPLREAFEDANDRKHQAIVGGETDTPAARQPWVYSYALRGNTFLMGGHSLGFFDFYRYADNAFVYETSNRDRRVWQWDSYLCDVGRSLSRLRGKRFGIYVKPHRGAPVQRALTAVARGARMIYWYTYGPDWSKGDTWGGKISILQNIARVSRLVARAEDVTYNSDWAVPAEVAIVRPRSAEFFSGPASWENGKWVYTALTHAHIPVDPLDEEFLLSEDLSRYRVILLCGDHVRRDVAEKLMKWVEVGGTLCTYGWGMAEDEGRRRLDNLLPLFGLHARNEMESWGTVPRYGATRLGAIRPEREPPEGAAVTGRGMLRGTFTPAVGRQVLIPAGNADVMATCMDGAAVVTRHRYGKGTAWLVGLYAGLEYAFETMHDRPFCNEKRTFVVAPVLEAGVRPVVDADDPLVEGVLLENRETGKLAVVLMNWRFRIDEPLTVTLRITTPATQARALALDMTLDLAEGEDTLRVKLPRLDEGEILLLE